MKFVIFADDFTGAIDTGVQFAQKGIPTGYYLEESALSRALSENQQEVYIINTKTRHLSAKMAYDKVYKFAIIANEANVDGILKKTDSALRGNIGSELAALMDATGGKQLSFIPAYPKMKRSTVNGIQYIDGVMVHQSVFGKDPFEPVMTSSVKELCSYGHHKGCNMTYEDLLQGLLPEEGIVIFDAQTMQDLHVIAKKLWKKEWTNRKKLVLIAGCAGIGEVIAECFPFSRKMPVSRSLYSCILVVCGSVNEITRKQAVYAQKHGFYRKSLNVAEYFEKLEEDDAEIITTWKWLEEIKGICEADTPCIIDTGFSDKEMIKEYSIQKKLSVTELGMQTSKILGGLLCYLARLRINSILMIIGGDTLQGFVEMLGCNEIRLHCELIPGVVLCTVIAEGIEQFVITKSGGFGDEDLLVVLKDGLKTKRGAFK